MALYVLDFLGVTDNFEQVLITNEVESSEVLPLLFKVLTESLLDVLERIREGREGLLEVGCLHDLHHDGVLVHCLH